MQHSAGLSFLSAVHAAFPLAALADFRPHLLALGADSQQRVSRVFKSSKLELEPLFNQAQKTFADVVSIGKRLPASAEPAINFSGAYSSTDFTELEVDCLVKIAATPGAQWTRDPSAVAGEQLVRITKEGHEQLPEAPAPIPDPRHERQPPPHEAANERLSTATAVHYPPGASHYIVGEVYGPLDSRSPSARATPIQKLLQLERILCFLLAKERKGIANICSCILGVVMIGPSLSDSVARGIYAALAANKRALKRLWALSKAGRLLAIRLQPPAARDLRQTIMLENLGAEVGQLGAKMGHMGAQIDQVLELLAGGGGGRAEAGGGGGHRGR